MDVYALLYLEGPTVQHQELCLMWCGSLDGRGLRETDTRTCVAESCCSSPETIPALSISCAHALSRSAVSDSLWPHGMQPTRLLCPWGSPGKNIGVGIQSLLQGQFPTQGQNLGLLSYRRILHHRSHQGSPGEGHTYIYSESFCCSPEIIRTVLIGYTPIQNKKNFLKK